MIKRNPMWLLIAMLILSIGIGCGDDDDDDSGAPAGDDDNDDADDDDDDDTVDDDDDDTFDPNTLPGRTYFLNIPLTNWTQPVGIGDIIGYYVPLILVNVLSVEEGQIEFIATVGIDTEEKAIIQDECEVTTLFPGGTLNDDGSFETGPHDFELGIFGLDTTLYDTILSGAFLNDGTGFENGVFQGLVDVRQVIDFFYYDADTICLLADSFGAECLPCPTDQQEYCVTIKAEEFAGEQVADLSIVEIGPTDIGPECDDDDDDDDNDDDDTTQ